MQNGDTVKKLTEEYAVAPSTIRRSVKLAAAAKKHVIFLTDTNTRLQVAVVFCTGGFMEACTSVFKSSAFVKNLELPSWVFENQDGEKLSIQEFLYK